MAELEWNTTNGQTDLLIVLLAATRLLVIGRQNSGGALPTDLLLGAAPLAATHFWPPTPTPSLGVVC